MAPVTVIGVHELDTVGQLAGLYGQVVIALFTATGLRWHASMMLEAQSKFPATHCKVHRIG